MLIFQQRNLKKFQLHALQKKHSRAKNFSYIHKASVKQEKQSRKKSNKILFERYCLENLTINTSSGKFKKIVKLFEKLGFKILKITNDIWIRNQFNIFFFIKLLINH